MKTFDETESGKRPTREQIRRAVATSTAIETRQSVSDLEEKLNSGRTRFPNARLAKPRF